VARKPSEAAPPLPPEAQLPVVDLAMLGQTRDLRHVAAWVTVQGQVVLSRELLCVDELPDAPEHAYQEALYQRVWCRKEPTAAQRLEAARECAPYKPTDLEHAHGYAVARRNGTWGLLEVHTEGDKVVKADCVTVADDFSDAFGRLLDYRDRVMVRKDKRRRT